MSSLKDRLNDAIRGSVLESRPEFAERYWEELERDENRDGETIMPFPVEAEANDELELGEIVQALRRVLQPPGHPQESGLALQAAQHLSPAG